MGFTDLYRLLERARGWLEEEYARYLQLKEYHGNMKNKVDQVAMQEFDTGRVKKVIRKIKKAEWRFNRYQKHLKPEMAAFSLEFASGEIDADYEAIQKVFDKINEELAVTDIASKHLLIDSSFHSGKLDRLYEHFQESLATHSMEQAHQAVIDIGVVIDDAITWIGSLSLELGDITEKQLPRLEEELRRRKEAEEEELKRKRQAEAEAAEKRRQELIAKEDVRVETYEKNKEESKRKKELEKLKARARQEMPVLNHVEKALRNLRRADALLQEPLLEMVIRLRGNILNVYEFPNIKQRLKLKNENDHQKYVDYLWEARKLLYKVNFKPDGSLRENEIKEFAKEYDKFRAIIYSEQKKHIVTTVMDINIMIEDAIGLLQKLKAYSLLFTYTGEGAISKQIAEVKSRLGGGWYLATDIIERTDPIKAAMVIILHLVFSVLTNVYALYAEVKNLRYEPSQDSIST